MYFPVADIEVHPLIPPLVAFVISFFTSMGGVSGAFLILPFQVSVLGFNTPAVSATNQLYNIVAIPSGVYRYIKEGRMVWPLTWIIVIGTLPGVFIGALLRIRVLPDPRDFKVFVGLVLLYIGRRLLREVLTERRSQKPVSQRDSIRRHDAPLPRAVVETFSRSRIVYEFGGRKYSVNVAGTLALSISVGVIGGIYGIGGGAIIAPFLVSVFGLPVYTVAGAALMGTFVTSIAGVLFYQIMAPFHPNAAVAPDWILGLLFGIGGIAGMYCGARMQKFVPAKIIKWILVCCILFPACKYIIEFFM